MATTSATGNQGSTGDQDPEPQQELISPAAGIRPPATARAGDAGRRLVQEDMAHDQAHQSRAPVHLNGNRGRANRRRRAARCGRRQPRQAHQDGETDQGGDPGGEYEGYEDRQARNAAGNAGVHQAKERRKPAVETDLGGLFDFHQDDTGDAAPVFVQEPGAGFDNAEPAPAVVMVVSEAANRPSDEGRERRNHEDETPERRRRLRRPRPVYPKKRDPETSEAARRMGVRSGEVRRQRRRLGPHIQRPELPKLNVRPEKPKRPPLWFRPPRLPGVKGP